MPTRYYDKHATIGGRKTLVESFYQQSNNSRRHPITGELVLEPQTYALDKRVLTGYKENPGVTPSYWPADLVGLNALATLPVGTPSLDNKATAKFYAQLSAGRAALGITMAQFAESRQMVIDRFAKISDTFDRVRHRATRRRKRITLSTAASDVLETEFGWVPLLSEIYALSATMFAMAIPPIKVTGRGSEPFTGSFVQPGSPQLNFEWAGKRKCCVDAFVMIENPNYWLVERAGASNPALVAWDAVPWSFVLSAFSNINAYLSQFTNLFGIKVDRVSTTRSVVYLRSGMVTGNIGISGTVDTWCLIRAKQRSVGTIPAVTLEFRLPALDLETAIIASSLVLQKVRRFAPDSMKGWLL